MVARKNAFVNEFRDKIKEDDDILYSRKFLKIKRGRVDKIYKINAMTSNHRDTGTKILTMTKCQTLNKRANRNRRVRIFPYLPGSLLRFFVAMQI